ncbi:hypothetical protein KPL70_017296 [Citrus sinensis]|nr:hypothetical protein KPL70_017296 [Citrus sinensis]
MATKVEDPSTSTPVVEESFDDNNDDEASQTEPVPPVRLISENSSKPSSSPWFTFDDIPRHKWQARQQEFAAWIDVQMTRPHVQTQNVLREFCSRFTGSLRDWFESLGEYRKLQLIQTTIATALAIIYEQFIGEPAVSTEASRKEYHQMKCCSLKRHHLEMHYKRMSMLYYKLNGFNYPSLKHVFAVSLPSKLQPELQRQLTAFNLDIANVSLGKIFQLTLLCLDKQSSMLSDNEDVESNFSKQLEKDDYTATVQEINQVHSKLTSPSVKISVIPSKFNKPVSVIGFLDTGTQRSMLNPKVLPLDYWENHTEYFRATNGKKTPPWGPAQTKAINQLKQIAQSPPPLKIPTTGQRILQKDASDDFWSAILLEKIGDSESYCAHASGQFKDSEKNYHVIYKEILAVKYGIKKFEFHLISHNFLIRIDNSFFPKIFDFKNKLLPDKYFKNVHRNKPERFPSLCLEHMFLTGFTIIPSLTISEDELWYMWCLIVLFATKLVLPVLLTLRHISTPNHAPTLLWTLLEWFSPLTWWRKQLQNLSNFHQLDRIPD